MDNKMLLQCQGVTKRIGNFVLRDIRFALEGGYILAVLGKNGSGKSTLVRSLLGSYKLDSYDGDKRNRTAETRSMAPNRGDVFLDGYSLKTQPAPYKERTAFVLQENPFSMQISAAGNGLLYGKYYKAFNQEGYLKLCREYGVPSDMPLKKLSRGEQIKMQLAFALSYDAKLYIMDEPAGNLDVRFRRDFYDIMRELVQNGDKSVLYVTHLAEELETLADYVLWLEKGEQKYFGALEELLDEHVSEHGRRATLKEVLCSER